LTEKELREKYVNLARSKVGAVQGDDTHRAIVDMYNTYKPLPRGHKLTYTEPWCAGNASSLAIEAELTTIIPVECSCNNQIAAFKAKGRWQEDDAFVPQMGDLVYYDWDDPATNYATTDNKGVVEHVGIVDSVEGTVITVIEGNYSQSVKYRTIRVNGRYIRGYGVPDYASLAQDAPQQVQPDGYQQFASYMASYRSETAKLDAADWSNAAREWNERVGLIQGVDAAGNMQWKSPVTREMALVIIHRYHEQIVQPLIDALRALTPDGK